MTKSLGIHVILAGVLGMAACGSNDGSSNSVNTAQSEAPPAATGSPATAETPGSALAPPVTSAPSTGTGSTAAPSVVPTPSVPPAPSVSATPPASVAREALPVYREVTIPSGTRLPLELLTTVSSETSKIEGPVRARLTRDVEIDGMVAIPSGTELRGVITEADRAGRVRGRARVAFRFTEAEVRGASERLRTNPVVLVGEASTKEDAAKIGGGAVAGAVIGGLLGGGKGAAQGAAIGGGAGTGVVLSTRGDEISLASGASVTATLATGLTLQVPR